MTDFSDTVASAQKAITEAMLYWSHHRQEVRQDGARGYVETVCIDVNSCPYHSGKSK